MKTFRLQIVTPEASMYDELSTSLSVPGAEGRTMVLSGHEKMVVNLKPGTIKVSAATGKSYEYDLLSAATLDVSPTSCIILANKINVL